MLHCCAALIEPARRNQGLGRMLVAHILELAAAAGHRRVYLFSTDAGGYWQRFGFQEVPVEELVQVPSNAPQVRLFAELGWLPTEVAWRRDG